MRFGLKEGEGEEREPRTHDGREYAADCLTGWLAELVVGRPYLRPWRRTGGGEGMREADMT